MAAKCRAVGERKERGEGGLFAFAFAFAFFGLVLFLYRFFFFLGSERGESSDGVGLGGARVFVPRVNLSHLEEERGVACECRVGVVFWAFATFGLFFVSSRQVYVLLERGGAR